MKNQLPLLIIAALVLLTLLAAIILGGLGFFVATRIQQNQAPADTTISNFKECEKAGYPIMESYPRQCRANGQTFTEEIQKNNDEYYGSSTMESCLEDTDCQTMGCNGEICSGKNSNSGISICIFPDKPLPKDLGYSCKCVSKKCQWNK